MVMAMIMKTTANMRDMRVSNTVLGAAILTLRAATAWTGCRMS